MLASALSGGVYWGWHQRTSLRGWPSDLTLNDIREQLCRGPGREGQEMRLELVVVVGYGGKGGRAGGEVGRVPETRLLWDKVGQTQPDLPGIERFWGCRALSDKTGTVPGKTSPR